jgi:hypothetical protein
VSVESHGGGDDARWEKLLIHPPELSGSHTSRDILEQVEGMDEGGEFCILRYVNESLTCRKILRHGASGFTSHPKKGVLRICIALKPSPLPVFNLRPLDPVESRLTTTPPRRISSLPAILPTLHESKVKDIITVQLLSMLLFIFANIKLYYL